MKAKERAQNLALLSVSKLTQSLDFTRQPHYRIHNIVIISYTIKLFFLWLGRGMGEKPGAKGPRSGRGGRGRVRGV